MKKEKKSAWTDIVGTVRKSGLVAAGDRLLAGVSGGADSVCLFLALKELSEEMGCNFAVVHIEHGLRGEASRADAAFVRKICEESAVPFYLKEVDVRAHTSTHVSEEEAARNLRREAYREAADALFPEGRVKIALAHNADDQAETVLMHLVRGTGIRGLCGMWETADFPLAERLQIIRPLLSVTRAQIEAGLAVRGQAYCTDETNGTDAYTRNRIRHRILPVLAEINPQAVLHIGQTAQAVRELEEDLEKEVDVTTKEAIVELRLNRVIVSTWSREMQNKIIKSWIYKRNQTVRNISSTHIRAISELLSAPNGTKADIPGAYRARVDGDYLVWEEKSGRNAPKKR